MNTKTDMRREEVSTQARETDSTTTPEVTCDTSLGKHPQHGRRNGYMPLLFAMSVASLVMMIWVAADIIPMLAGGPESSRSSHTLASLYEAMRQSGNKAIGIMWLTIGMNMATHVEILGSLLMRVLSERKRRPVATGKPSLARTYLMVTVAIGSILSGGAAICWYTAGNVPVAFAYAATNLGAILLTIVTVIALVRGLPQSGYDHLASGMRLILESE